MKRLITDVYHSQVRKLSKLRAMFIATLLLCSVCIVVLSILFLPYLKPRIWGNYGLFFEFCSLLLLLFIFWSIQFAPFGNRPFIIINIGLVLWILAGVEDVMDEFYRQPLWLSIWGEDLLRTLGITLVTIGTYVTIKDISSAYDKIKRLAIIDELTELPNRRYFRYKLTNHEKNTLFILLIDLDHFKKINDLYGHAKGDAILYEFGKVLLMLTPKNAVSARLGGEEFAVYISSENEQEVTKFAQTLLSGTRSILISEDHYLSASIGIAKKSYDESTHDAMKRSDTALYLAKQNGRNRLEWSTESSPIS